jgi:hypothetical protein
MSLGRYVGTLCSRCESGRFLMMGTCTIKCEDIEPHAAFGVVTVFGITACVICWLVMNRMTAGRFDAMDVGLLYCQIIDIVFNFSTNQRVSRDSWYVTTRIFSIVNYDVDFISASCLLGSWGCASHRGSCCLFA